MLFLAARKNFFVYRLSWFFRCSRMMILRREFCIVRILFFSRCTRTVLVTNAVCCLGFLSGFSMFWVFVLYLTAKLFIAWLSFILARE